MWAATHCPRCSRGRWARAGFDGLELDPSPDGLLADLPGGQHGRQKPGDESIHFPDGNATLARLLVRWLIPDALPGKTQEDLGTGRVNYALLDRDPQCGENQAQQHRAQRAPRRRPGSAKEVIVTYNTDGRLYDIRGQACIMACWNMFIPYLAPELPAAQKEALAFNVKGPIVYTNVFLRNWKSFEKLGISSVECPTMYHDSVELAEAADLGDLHHARTPNEPIAVRLTRMPGSPGLPRKEQHRIGRAELQATSFDMFEYKIRDQLARIYPPGGSIRRATSWGSP